MSDSSPPPTTAIPSVTKKLWKATVRGGGGRWGSGTDVRSGLGCLARAAETYFLSFKMYQTYAGPFPLPVPLKK